MLKPIALTTLALLTLAGTVGSASALTKQEVSRCKSIAVELPKLQVSLSERKEALDALILVAEDKGDLWEEAEAIRTWTPENAAKADSLKAEWLEAKARAEAAAATLAEDAVKANADAAWYNQVCAG